MDPHLADPLPFQHEPILFPSGQQVGDQSCDLRIAWLERAVPGEQPSGLLQALLHIDLDECAEVYVSAIGVNEPVVSLPDSPDRRSQAGLGPLVRALAPQTLRERRAVLRCPGRT